MLSQIFDVCFSRRSDKKESECRISNPPSCEMEMKAQIKFSLYHIKLFEEEKFQDRVELGDSIYYTTYGRPIAQKGPFEHVSESNRKLEYPQLK